MYKQLCEEIAALIARHLAGEDVEADLAAWSRKFEETQEGAISEEEEDRVARESVQRLRGIAAAMGWTASGPGGFWRREAHGPVHTDDLMPILLDQLRGAVGREVGAIGQQIERVSERFPVYRFLKALYDLQAQGKAYLHPKGDSDPDRAGVARVGWYDPQSTTIYLISELALRQVKAYWRARGELFGSGMYAIHRDLSQMGCIESSNPGRFTRQVWISSREKTRRVLVLDAQRVYDKTGLVLSDGVETRPNAAGPR